MGVLAGKCVLLVDDEPFVRYIFASELEDAGAEIIEAIDGLQALTLIEQGLKLDALVTDVRMPNMDGWTLAERARERHAELPVLYVTGYSDVAARPVPGAQVLGKPVGAFVITNKVATMLAGVSGTA